MKTEKVVQIGLVREEDWLYYIDLDGDISRVPLSLPKKNEKKDD